MKVSVIGATGYTGVELVKLLAKHKHIQLVALTSETYAGKKISEVFSILSNICDIVLTQNDIEHHAENADIFFLCLPHKTAMEIAKTLYNKGKIVIDLSADFRMSDYELYEKVYDVSHTAKELLQYAVYGNAELYADKIAKTRLVAVPGCYPTSVITPMYPLIEAGMVDVSYIVADSKSGVSGAGRKASLATSYCETNEDFKAYGVLSHRHNDEMNDILGKVDSNVDVVFTPHLLPINRGIESTIYFKSDKSADELFDVIANKYKHNKLVRMRKNIPAIKDVANQPFIDIAVYKKGNQAIILSVIDNLLKGASSQAVQCMNIIMGLEDSEGLI